MPHARSGFQQAFARRTLLSARSRLLRRIVAIQPLLNFFLLGRNHNALPFHDSRPFTVLSHNVGTFIEYLDEALSLGSFEAERSKCGMVFFHGYN
jgi:hypothetical protein